jgi:hypothetical protein
MAKSMAPGGGGRFEALENKLEKRKGVRNAKRLAAWIGMHKYGNARMHQFSAQGRHRAAIARGRSS